MRPTPCLNRQRYELGQVELTLWMLLYWLLMVVVHMVVHGCRFYNVQVLENVINKQQLQIQASNLGHEAQVQRVQAQQHAAAQQEAHAAAQHAAVQAQQHAKLHAEATMQADSIKRVIQGMLWGGALCACCVWCVYGCVRAYCT